MTNNRGSFKSNFGFMMAVAGSAVGLGNIWRFPYMMGENGGAAFLILYLIMILLVGLPLILSEFIIGRSTQKGCVSAFKALKPNTKWHYIGYISVIVGFAILGFYSVIAGWTLNFVVDAVSNGFTMVSSGEVKESFEVFVNNGWQPIMYAVIFVAMVVFIVLKGIEKGIEKYNKILMPVLFVLLIVMCINSVTMDGFAEGMSFMFTPDFSEITTQTILDALGQVFFSLSIGMGVMITYSSYSTCEENMFTSKLKITAIDTMIALISGVAIFPAVFTYGISPTEGPSLVFLALPTVFAQMSFGAFFGSLFFILLLIAAITSAVSIFEMLVTFYVEKFNTSRARALMMITSGVLILAVLSALSQIEGSSIMIGQNNFFDFLDLLSSNYLLTSGGLLIAIFTGWFFGKEKLQRIFTSKGKYANRMFAPYYFAIRYIAPIAVAAVLLSRIGII